MRIISTFKDYYDSAQAFGNDASLTFVRKTRVLKDSDADLNDWELDGFGDMNSPSCPEFHWHASRRYGRIHYEKIVVGFCGKRYLLYKIDGMIYSGVIEFFEAVDNGKSVNNYSESYYGSDSKKERFKKHVRFVAQSRANDKRSRGFCTLNGTSASRFIFSELGWSQWLQHTNGKMIVPVKTHRYWETPIISRTILNGDNKDQINPCLKTLNFHKIMDAYTCFQEIDLYLGNNMVDQFDPSANRTDIEIRDSHGMNEWSFRSPAPGRKKRKQKKRRN